MGRTVYGTYESRNAVLGEMKTCRTCGNCSIVTHTVNTQKHEVLSCRAGRPSINIAGHAAWPILQHEDEKSLWCMEHTALIKETGHVNL